MTIRAPQHEAPLSQEKIEGCKRPVAVVRKIVGEGRRKRKNKQRTPSFENIPRALLLLK